MTGLVVDITAPSRAPNELVIAGAAGKVSGWQDVEVTLRAEGFPNLFEATFSSQTPNSGVATALAPGSECQIYLGDNQVISGFVDSAVERGGPDMHFLTVSGRGRTQDLVDCSAEWRGGQIYGASAYDVITRLASASGTVVHLAEGAPAGDAIVQFNLNYGETAADLIQRVAHSAGLMAYEDINGGLVLALAGTTKAASGVVFGVNVESWSVENSMDQRYSDIVCVRYTQDVQSDIGVGGAFFDTEKDPGVPRHRLLYIPMEQAADPQAFTIRKAKWEIARRIGRSRIARATVDSWNDSDGNLWMPNTLVPVTLPSLLPGPLCISEVTFRRSEETGTTAELTMMDPRAFTPEPFSLLQVNTSDISGPDGGAQ